MRYNIYSRLIKLAITEILIQTGFECCSEMSLNITADIYIYYMECLIRKLSVLKDVDPNIQMKYVLKDLFNEEEYQFQEFIQFLDQQQMIKRYIKEKSDKDPDNNLLSMLKVLPKNINLKTSFKNSKNLTLEEKFTQHSNSELEMDKYLNEFIEKCSQIKADNVEYKVLDSIPHPVVEIKENIESLNPDCRIVEEEEAFISEDREIQTDFLLPFYFEEKYKAFKP